MDYRKYDQLQAELGGIGDTLRSELQPLLEASTADADAKDLVRAVAICISRRLDELALTVSETLRLMIDSNK